MTLGSFRPNTTFTPDPNDYLLGRGNLFFAELLSTDLPDLAVDKGFIEVGNIPEFSVSSETNFLDHFSSQSGLRVRDKRIIIDQAVNIDFAGEEFSEDLAKLWFFSTPAAGTNGAIAGVATDTQIITNVKKGHWYPIINQAGNPVFNIRSTDITAVKKSPSTTLVLNTDYEIRLPEGMIRIKTSSSVADGDEILMTLAANASATAIRYIPLSNRTAVDVCVRFIGRHAETDRKFLLHLNKVSLSPRGNLQLVTANEWARMGFTGACERTPSATYPVGYIISLDDTT